MEEKTIGVKLSKRHRDMLNAVTEESRLTNKAQFEVMIEQAYAMLVGRRSLKSA